MGLIRCCFVFLSIIYLAKCSRILGIFHMNSYSHFIMGDRIVKELAARGHDVTVISPFEEKEPPIKNLRRILLPDYNRQLTAAKNNMLQRADMGVLSSAKRFTQFGLVFTESFLNNTSVQNLLKSDEKFDLIIFEKFFNEAFSGFAYHFKVPFVTISGTGASRWSSPQMGNPYNPSYVPDLFLSLTSNMDFYERSTNTLVVVGSELFDYFWRLPKQNDLLQKFFPGAPHLSELHYNSSLMLINSVAGINSPVPLVPNMIEIGGYHIMPPKPLPKELQDYLDSAKDGVIFFSMGSNLKSADMTDQKRDDILKVFATLNEKVLWKWEGDSFPGQPPNVKLVKWLPQQDILAHPNVKLFITHGGLLSITEAIYHGVPIIAIPVFGDQLVNAKTAEQSGYGLELPYSKLNSETLNSALREILSNQKYRENAQHRSTIMQDQPMRALDKAMYWIEYVIRHQGAPHLKTAGLRLSWYQYLVIDVIVIIASVLIFTGWIIWKIAKLLYRRKSNRLDSKSKKKD